MADNDVPSPVDFRRMADAAAWEQTAMLRLKPATGIVEAFCVRGLMNGLLDFNTAGRHPGPALTGAHHGG